MRHHQVLVCESDGRLAAMLRPIAQEHGWRLQEIRHPRVGPGLVPQGKESVFVLRAGRDLQREMALLEHITWQFPETSSIVICDADNPALVQLVWDLGARFVLHPPQIPELLADIVKGYLRDSIQDQTELLPETLEPPPESVVK